MYRKSFFLLILCVVSLVFLSGCGFVRETDGQRRFAVFSLESNQRTRTESTTGRGGWNHSPKSSTVHNGNSAAVTRLLGRNQEDD